ncbi:MAG: xylulokinase, partial [Bacteroidota bacterium]|nr:xylulokinase [Bacteroidota bacterium]
MLLGIDVSTTATKALLIDPDGSLKGVASAPHRLLTPKPLWSEQDPEEWWNATRSAIRHVLDRAGVKGDAISGIGLSGQMHGLVLLDDAGNVIRPAILWNDQRASEECTLIRYTLGLEELVRETGNDAFAGFSLPKLLWVRTHEPEHYAQIAQILLPKDYIRFKLTGEFATDKAGAGGTLMLGLESRDWSNMVTQEFDVHREWLSPTHEGAEITGSVTASAATRTGLVAGTPVVAGGGDQAAQAVGVGAVSTDVQALTIGTSGVVFAPTDRPVTESRGRIHAFPHALSGMWHVMGVMLSAAGSLHWYRDTFTDDEPFEELVREAASAPSGSEGLFFLPYLTGERTPHADPEARGAFIGLTRSHRRGHLTRAVLEGVAFGLRDNLDLLVESGVAAPRELLASGGAMRSPLWRQIIADVLNVPLIPVVATEGAALGAAMLAG